MIIYDSFNEELKNNPCVLIFGDFDGVHLGHGSLIDLAKEYAKKENLSVGVYNFKVNSKLFLGKNNSGVLTTDKEKNILFERYGVDFVFYDDFSKIKDFSPEEFCSYIADNFSVKCVLCGENFRFGKNASAGAFDFSLIMESFGIKSKIGETLMYCGKRISSSSIRDFLISGNINKANELLGYNYFIINKVSHGKELGRTLGFPTINQLSYGNKCVPASGVYVTKCTILNKEYMGVTNVGYKPTVNENCKEVTFETHIVDFHEFLYDKTVKVEFLSKLRDEKKFSSLDELKENVLKNIAEAKDYFKEMGWQNNV